MTPARGSRSRSGGAPPAEPPHRVRLPVNVHHWDTISFLHWPFDPDDIAPLVPDELTVLTYDGAAWVTVTPFFIRVRPPGSPIVPPGWAFPETNVRTYVAGPDGREGLWFLHMEVTARWFVAALRAFGLPYFHHNMTVEAEHNGVRYTSAPGRPPSVGGHHIAVHRGAALRPASGGPWERFVTARWAAYHHRGRLLYTPVEHEPWPLHTADVTACDVGALFRAAGLSVPASPAHAHFSPGVAVRVGVPQVVM